MSLESLQQQLAQVTVRYKRLALLEAIALVLAPNDPAQALEHSKKALDIAEPKEKGRVLRRHGACFLARGDFDSACDVLNQAREIFEQEKDAEKELAATLRELGNAYLDKGLHRRALKLYTESLELSRAVNNIDGVAASLQAIGNLSSAIGDHETALKNYQDAHRELSETGREEAIGIFLCDMAVTNAELHEHERALDLFNQALERFNRPHLRLLKIRAYANIANVYYAMDDLDSALQHALHAMTLSDASGEKRDLAMAYSTIGLIMEKKGNMEDALDYQMKALKLIKKIDDRGLRLAVNLNVGNLFRKLEHADTITILEEVLRLAHDLGDPQIEAQAHRLLAETWESREDFAAALRHHKSFSARLQEAQLREKQRAIIQLQLQFDVEQAQKEKEIYRLKSERLALEVKNKNIRLDSLIENLTERTKLVDKIRRSVQEIDRRATAKLKPLTQELLKELQETKSSPEFLKIDDELYQMHEDFIRRLTERYPTLQPAQIRICVLLRVGKSTKQAAVITHVEKETVSTHRYRIGKIIDDRPPGMNLATYLMGF